MKRYLFTIAILLSLVLPVAAQSMSDTQVLQYIHEHYDPKATAKLVEPLSTETGLDIYRILK